MATIREGNQPVLLVVDIQVGVMAEAWDAPRAVQNVAQVVERVLPTMYTEAWRVFVRGKYGTEPVVTYFECPVIVDNVAGQVLSGESGA